MNGWSCGNCSHFMTTNQRPLRCPICGNRKDFNRHGGKKDE